MNNDTTPTMYQEQQVNDGSTRPRWVRDQIETNKRVKEGVIYYPESLTKEVSE